MYQVVGMSQRAIASKLGHSRKTIKKALAHAVPLPHGSKGGSRKKPTLGPFVAIIDAWLKWDLDQPRKQRHTARRIYERLRAEHGYTGHLRTIRRYVGEDQGIDRPFLASTKVTLYAHEPPHPAAEARRATTGELLDEMAVRNFGLPYAESRADVLVVYCEGTQVTMRAQWVRLVPLLGVVGSSPVSSAKRVSVESRAAASGCGNAAVHDTH